MSRYISINNSGYSGKGLGLEEQSRKTIVLGELHSIFYHNLVEKNLKKNMYKHTHTHTHTHIYIYV